MNTKFDLEECKRLYDQTTIIEMNKKTFNQACKDYINKFFYTMNTGEFFQFHEDKFILQTTQTIKSVYFNRLPSDVSNWFFKENTKIYELIFDVTKPKIGNNYINIFDGFIHEKKDYNTYSDDIKEKVNLMNSYVMEVLASNNQASFDYLMKWHSNVIKGKKNQSALYLKGREGIGKSTLAEFIKDYVLGPKSSTKADSTPLLTPFNKMLLGKLFVLFEELPTFTESQWSGVSSKIKDWVTSDTMLYSDKMEKQFEAKNYNNYVINANHEAIKESQGRRYFIVDVSTVHETDHEYFGNLRSKCFKKEVAEAYYNYLLTIDTTNFESQRDMPETKSKKNVIADLLCIEYKFLKDEYILKNNNISKVTPKSLHSNYSDYCSIKEKKPVSLIRFSAKLREIGIEYRKIHGDNVYNVSLDDLKKIAEKHKWMHELDEYVKDDKEPIINDLDHGVDKIDEIKLLQKQILEMSELNMKLTEQLRALQKTSQIIPKIEVDNVRNVEIRTVKDDIAVILENKKLILNLFD